MWGSIAAFTVGAVAMVLASLREPRKTDEELHGLVYGMAIQDASDRVTYPWYRSPVVLGAGVLVVCVALYVGVSVV
jgi:SSS family solute:Na+ symporter